MNLLKHLTHIDGTTVGDIVKATGLPITQVRAELVALEAEGKAIRERGKVGYPHLWWRADRKPLEDDVVLLCMGLAANIHRSSSKLRAVLASLSTRAANPNLRQVLAMAKTSKDPHAVVEGTLRLL